MTKTFSTILPLALVAIFLALPSITLAFVSTDQSATVLNNQTALFTISYEFSLKDGGYLPLGAIRDLPHDSAQKSVGYELLTDGKTLSTIGTAYGLVLSTATVVDDMYYLSPGESETFTLFTIYRVSPESDESGYVLQMTDLPFYVGETKTYQRLNVSELAAYRSPEVELNDR